MWLASATQALHRAAVLGYRCRVCTLSQFKRDQDSLKDLRKTLREKCEILSLYLKIKKQQIFCSSSLPLFLVTVWMWYGYSFSYFHFSLLYPHLACYTFSLSVFLWAHLCLIILLPAVYLVCSFSLWQFIKLSASCLFVCPMCFLFLFIFFNFSLILISFFTHWIFFSVP